MFPGLKIFLNFCLWKSSDGWPNQAESKFQRHFFYPQNFKGNKQTQHDSVHTAAPQSNV